MIPLYDHQKRIIDEDRKWAGLFLGTGSSKSRTALELATGTTLIIVPKDLRLEKKFEKECATFGIVKDITVLSKEEFRRDWQKLPYFETVIADECFPANTKVLTPNGYKNIQDLRIGDSVINAVGNGIITKTMSKISDTLCEVFLSNHNSIIVTPNHPLLTTIGWIPAGHLNNTHLLVHSDMIYLEHEKTTTVLQSMRQANRERNSPRWSMGAVEKILFSAMQVICCVASTSQWQTKECSSYIKNLIRSDEKKQSDEKSRLEEKSDGYPKKDWTQTKDKRWKWANNANSAKDATCGAWGWVVCRACCLDKVIWHFKRKISNLLQNRYCKSYKKNCDRGRWFKSLIIRKEKAGYKKAGAFKTIRVERVEIRKQKDNGKHRRGIKVYNLSVSNHPSYVVQNIIAHNCHAFFGIQPYTVQRKGVQYPKTSQMFDALYGYLNRHKPLRFYALTATPASKPMNVYAIGKLFGRDWNFYEFRDRYYLERKMGFRSIWIPRNTEILQDELASLIKKFGYTGQLSDYFDLPEQTFITHHVSLTTQQKEAIKTYVASEADPMLRRSKQRIIENGCLYIYDIENINEKEDRMVKKTITFSSEKIEYIKERAEEFDKLLVFANWTGQVHAIAKALEDAGYTVYTLTGQTKNRAETIEMAEKSSKCIVVAQCTISAGYELPSFPCVVFASLNWQSLHHIQAKGRVLRSNKLKKNLYIYLVIKEKGGSVDMDCYNAIMNGQNFNEKVFE